MPDASRIVALLGPTNTGKTHRAVERMLEHESGVIGLPLRLLAREVYDRISARIGRDAVALVTGEEKIVPPRPRYWVATVESMPLSDVAFVAVDEIQLVAHRERGHVFTDRLLHARGSNETWFMGSDAMRLPRVGGAQGGGDGGRVDHGGRRGCTESQAPASGRAGEPEKPGELAGDVALHGTPRPPRSMIGGCDASCSSPR